MRLILNLLFMLMIFFSIDSYAGIFSYDSYFDCILGEMPNAKNDLVAQKIIISCRKESPNTYIEKKGGLFGVKSVETCLDKYLNETSSQLGAMQIRYACNNLYLKN